MSKISITHDSISSERNFQNKKKKKKKSWKIHVIKLTAHRWRATTRAIYFPRNYHWRRSVSYNINRSSLLSRYFHWTGSNHRKLFDRPPRHAIIINLPPRPPRSTSTAIYNHPFNPPPPLDPSFQSVIPWATIRNWIKSRRNELTEHRKRARAQNRLRTSPLLKRWN